MDDRAANRLVTAWNYIGTNCPCTKECCYVIEPRTRNSQRKPARKCSNPTDGPSRYQVVRSARISQETFAAPKRQFEDVAQYKPVRNIKTRKRPLRSQVRIVLNRTRTRKLHLKKASRSHKIGDQFRPSAVCQDSASVGKTLLDRGLQ